MKLLLTSNGLTSEELRKRFLNLLDKPIKTTKILLLFGIKTEEELKYVNESERELIDLGISNDNIIKVDFSKEVDLTKLTNFDAIYFCGGNTYYILDRIRKTGLADLIKKSVNQGYLYVGVSAGSIIMGPNVEIAGWGSEGDANAVNLNDLNALNIITLGIFPHYKDKLESEVNEFRKKVNYPIETIKDGEGILIR